MGKLAWYVAVGGGLTRLLLSVTVVLGLLTASRILGRRVSRAQLEHVHRIVGEVAMIFVGVHILGLFLDTYVHFGPAELFVLPRRAGIRLRSHSGSSRSGSSSW